MNEKKNSGRKVIVLVLVLSLLLGCAAGGTLAWLVAQSDTITNTFTEGNIDISLVEHKLDLQTGKQISPAQWVTEQEGDIELLPGRTVYKDPTVKVDAGSEPCYVRVFMIVDYGHYMDNAYEGTEVIKQWFAFDSNWSFRDVWEDKKANDYGHVFEFLYNGAVTANEDTYLTLFRSITIPSELAKDADPLRDMYSCLSEAKLIFVAQAVQVREGMDPFEDVPYPNVTLAMNNGSMTLEELINRNISHLTPNP